MTATATCDAVRARLWLTAREYGDGSEAALLWLHLADGRVLAFRLAAHCLGDDTLIPEIVAAVADDARGEVLEFAVPDRNLLCPLVLYAAPAAPMPALAWGHPKHAEARRFAAGLDQTLLECLARLDAHRVWSSCRNYNRLVQGESGLRRRQAVERFPVLAAPILLTAHHAYDSSGGKRFAWRDHDDDVVEAAEYGRDLAGALARHYGISKALVRAPMCTEMWGEHGVSHCNLLRLFDRIPASARPKTVNGLERYTCLLPAFNSLIYENSAGSIDTHDIYSTVFKSGFEYVWQTCVADHPDLGNALVDCRDFLRAASARAAELVPTQRLDTAKLAALWLTRRGLKSLLDASQRWHLWHDQTVAPSFAGHVTLLPVLGAWQDTAGHTAHEILSWVELAAEGAAMHHCVADYWEDCVTAGTRIFHLSSPDGARATAAYRCIGLTDATPIFGLLQLRGPCNAEATRSLDAFSRVLHAAIEAPERAEARRNVAAQARAVRDAMPPFEPRPPAISLDPISERALTRLLQTLECTATALHLSARATCQRKRTPIQEFFHRRAFFATHPAHANGHRPCPACGYPTLPPEGDHDTCPVCHWENDGQDDHDAGDYKGGPNDHSLAIARENFGITSCIWAASEADEFSELNAARLFSAAARANQRRMRARYDALRRLHQPRDIARQWERIEAYWEAARTAHNVL